MFVWGSTLESKRNPGKLEKFTKNKKQKRIIIGSIIGVILLIGGITLYKTFALYEEKKEFNVLKGVVPDFRPKELLEDKLIELASKDENVCGNNGIVEVKHDDANITNSALAAEELNNLKQTEYRYCGADPNNYVTFNDKFPDGEL